MINRTYTSSVTGAQTVAWQQTKTFDKSLERGTDEQTVIIVPRQELGLFLFKVVTAQNTNMWCILIKKEKSLG